MEQLPLLEPINQEKACMRLNHFHAPYLTCSQSIFNCIT